MITSKIQDRVIEFIASSSDFSSTPSNVNYFKVDLDTKGYVLEEDNDDNSFVPIQQGSTIRTPSHVYMYFISANPNATTGQTGTWETIN